MWGSGRKFHPEDHCLASWGFAEWYKTVIPRYGVWHREALPSDAKQWSRGTVFGIVRLCRVMQNSDPEGRNFLSALKTHVSLMFHSFCCIPSISYVYFESSIHYHAQWCWRRTFLNLTSLWHCSDVNLTIKLCDVLYNQCKLNSHENFLFGMR